MRSLYSSVCKTYIHPTKYRNTSNLHRESHRRGEGTRHTVVLAGLQTLKGDRLVNVKAESRLTVPVTRERDEGAALSAYMALPVSQFVLIDVPMGGQLHRIGQDLFELTVPRLEFFGLWVQPNIKCTASNDSEKVDIQSVSLQIEGSDLVHSLQLNDRVAFAVTCRFTHREGSHPSILSHAKIDATVDPPVPFRLIPDEVLAQTASQVLEVSLSALLRTFVSSLAADYAMWAKSKQYRDARKQYAVESDKELIG